MQPESNNPEHWQQPTEQPAQTPYAAPEAAEEPPTQPVVTMQPDGPSQASQLPEVESAPTAQQPAPVVSDEPVRWQATEYIHREKNSLWFVGFALVTIALMALAIFLMQSWTFAVLVPVMAVALLVYTQRPPRTLSYTLSRQGLHINDRLYPFVDFKAFAVIKGDDEHSISLIPIKRFRPAVSVYFPEAVGESIVDMMAARLPMQEFHLDFVDQIIRKLRL